MQVKELDLTRILTIEDDVPTAEAIAAELNVRGYKVDVVGNGNEGLAMALQGKYDAITVDRMLPGLDGLSIVTALRNAGLQTPILMISALSDVDERIRGLRAGGDDYMIKPFDFGELCARLEVLLRRRMNNSEVVSLKLADLEIELLQRLVLRAGCEIELMPKEFRLLEYLMKNAGQTLTKRMILEAVWNCHFDPSTNLIEVHIARLRKKIDLPGLLPLIHTVRGSGYTLSAEQ